MQRERGDRGQGAERGEQVPHEEAEEDEDFATGRIFANPLNRKGPDPEVIDMIVHDPEVVGRGELNLETD